MGKKKTAGAAAIDTLWYKDAVVYELHVRAYRDSDADGVGDFRGLAEKMDYLQDLGVTAVWLLPFYPSPLKDDGYDTADYTSVHPAYGELRHFKLFLREAHARGLRVITELVLNHTSDQHPWFQRARRARPGTAARDFYVWSDDPERYKETRIIFKDFEPSNWSWDPVARAYYWHRFYAHQPDLNWDSPGVRRAMLKVVDFWFGEVGVDGLRLDAVPYLYEREGTNCENLPETHQALKELRAHVDRSHPDRMLLAEANQWPEDSVAYFGAGDECHTAFHFPIMPRLFMSLRTEDRYPIVDMLEQTPPIPDTCQWVLFLRNHDELTLEMVTDEERDYMYRVYAQDTRARINLGIRRRLAPLLGNSRSKIELLNGLLFSLPGTPVIYYGDEIGMGDNFYLGDRNGVRTPMQWSPDRNAGFSQANSQQLYLPVIIDPEYHYEAINVEVQQNNPQSLLWWTKRMIALRKRYRAFGRGVMTMLYPDNAKVLAFVRTHGEESVLVVANLSRYAQHAELSLPAFRGRRPVELFGRASFPVVGEGPYSIALGPHGLYWFLLEPQRPDARHADAELPPPVLELSGRLPALFEDERLEGLLPAYLAGRRWFGGKARALQGARVVEVLPLSPGAAVALAEVEYAEGEPETYTVPLAAVPGRGDEAGAPPRATVVAALRLDDKPHVLVDALWDRASADRLLAMMARQVTVKGRHGELEGWSTREVRKALEDGADLTPSLLGAEQSNTSLRYGSRFILKLVRRLEGGTSPDLEIGRFLTEKAGFTHSPPVLGALEYRRGRGAPRTLAILQGFVANEGDAWRFSMDALGRYFDRVLTQKAGASPAAVPEGPPSLFGSEPTPVVYEMLGTYVQAAELMGRRTAELHRALSSDAEDPAFAPEPFTTLYQRSLVQSARNLVRQAFTLLRRRLRDLPEDARDEAQRVLALEGELLRRTKAALTRRITGQRIRVHGDFHLGQVLYTGRDFVIIDFEGEPARPLGERLIKRSALRDVAGMVRSFHYSGHAALLQRLASGQLRREDVTVLEPWARYWERWASAVFVRGYLASAGEGAWLSSSPDERRQLLTAYLLDKAVYELAYELNNRPDWVRIPLVGILDLALGAES
jgi:maltose alpha-D-glucosyltransferase/alpha-amylase